MRGGDIMKSRIPLIRYDFDEFEPIPGTFGKYTIRKDGVIFNKELRLIIRPRLSKDGYYRVNLNVKNKKSAHTIHRLLAQTYISNPYRLSYVTFIDGNKSNYHVDNLEWTDGKANHIPGKWVIGYHGRYKVNINGDVYSYSTKKNLSPTILENGTRRVTLVDCNGFTKQHYVHRMIWEHYVGILDNSTIVWFKDENPENLTLENLYIVPRSEFHHRDL